jgi:hypothetical protein
LSHQRKRKGKKKKKKGSGDISPEAVAHLPAAVSLLLLEVLFMQISGMNLTLT